MRLLAEACPRRGRSIPPRDPIPGPPPRRPVHRAPPTRRPAAVHGAGWLVDAPARMRSRAAGALNECGRRLRSSWPAGGSTRSASPRRATRCIRITVHGTWGHGSMPRDDNAAGPGGRGRSARLADPGEPRVTAPIAARFLDGVAAELPPDPAGARRGRIGGRRPATERGRDPGAVRSGLGAGDPRASSATRSARTCIHAGVKYNVIPGRGRASRSTAGRCPGRRPTTTREEVMARLGDLATHCSIEHVIGRAPGRRRSAGSSTASSSRRSVAHDPEGVPVPVDGRRSRPTPSTTALRSASRPTGSRRSASRPTSGSSPGSTASTSGSASTRCAGACPSCTTSSADVLRLSPPGSAATGARRGRRCPRRRG